MALVTGAAAWDPLTEYGRYHWHIEIAPIFAKKGGLEYGSQCMVLMVSPEVAARNLRETDAEHDDDDYE